MSDTQMSNADDYLVIARVTSVFGIKGWVKLKSFTQPEDNVFSYQECFLKRGGKWQAIELVDGKHHGKGLIAKIKGVDDRNTAETLVKSDLAILRSELPELEEDDFYWHQLEGLTVQTDAEVILGKVSHLIETGSNDVLCLKPCEGSIDDKERMLPYRDEVVLSVSLNDKTITVDWDPEF